MSVRTLYLRPDWDKMRKMQVWSLWQGIDPATLHGRSPRITFFVLVLAVQWRHSSQIGVGKRLLRAHF